LLNMKTRKTCIICMETVASWQLQRTKCTHDYHRACIKDLKSAKHLTDNLPVACPLCKTPIPMDTQDVCELCEDELDAESAVVVRGCGCKLHEDCILSHIQNSNIEFDLVWDFTLPCPGSCATNMVAYRPIRSRNDNGTRNWVEKNDWNVRATDIIDRLTKSGRFVDSGAKALEEYDSRMGVNARQEDREIIGDFWWQKSANAL